MSFQASIEMYVHLSLGEAWSMHHVSREVVAAKLLERVYLTLYTLDIVSLSYLAVHLHQNQSSTAISGACD